MKFRIPPKHFVVVGICLALTFSVALAWASSSTESIDGSPRMGYDPLSLAEQDRAREIAFSDARISAKLADAAHVELLLIERHQEPKDVTQQGDTTRRADVYIYRYDDDVLVQAIVNLYSARVDSVTTTQDVQLPLTESEATRAMQLVLDDPSAGAVIRAQYQQITAQALRNPDQQLRIHALIFRADAMPTLLGTATCGIRRCAQLMIATQDDVLIDVLPVVDLSTGKLIELSRFIEE